MTVIIMTKRYKHATVFVDQDSKLSFTWIKDSSTAEDTVKGKLSFDAYSKDSVLNTQNYHYDNDIFQDNLWTNGCDIKVQKIIFVGVNAHHQNCIAENARLLSTSSDQKKSEPCKGKPVSSDFGILYPAPKIKNQNLNIKIC